MKRRMRDTRHEDLPCPAHGPEPDDARPNREVLWDYIKAATGIIAALGTLAAAVAQIIGALRR